jgi:nucleotide-binding universal stress UspA family protein
MIRQILVPLTGTAFDTHALAAALSLSRGFGAQLECLHVRPDPAAAAVGLAGGDMGGGYAIAELMEVIEQQAIAGEAKARADFDAFRTGPGLGQAAELSVRTGDEALSLVEHGRAADLVVIGRQRGEGAVDMGLLQTVLVGVGRPVMLAAAVVPATRGAIVAVAWKDSAAAARGIAGALPFIEAAAEVLVMCVEEQGTEADGPAEDDSLDRVVRALRRHNPNVAARSIEHGGAEPVEALLGAVHQVGAGLLVAGGYGHGVLRETVFGGFTQHLLRNAPLAVLMTH